MHRSEPDDRAVDTSPRAKPPFDWRGWVVLAWVLWFGLLYGKMVLETRGHRVREMMPQSRIAP